MGQYCCGNPQADQRYDLNQDAGVTNFPDFNARHLAMVIILQAWARGNLDRKKVKKLKVELKRGGGIGRINMQRATGQINYNNVEVQVSKLGITQLQMTRQKLG